MKEGTWEHCTRWARPEVVIEPTWAARHTTVYRPTFYSCVSLNTTTENRLLFGRWSLGTSSRNTELNLSLACFLLINIYSLGLLNCSCFSNYTFDPSSCHMCLHYKSLVKRHQLLMLPGENMLMQDTNRLLTPHPNYHRLYKIWLCTCTFVH